MNEVSSGAARPDAVRDLSAALQAQQPVGTAASDELAQNFLARVQRDIDEQVDQRLQQCLANWKGPRSVATAGKDWRDVAVTSLIIGAILTVAKASDLGVAGIAVVWGAVIAVNIIWAIVSIVRMVL
ncbi:MAG TPA: hypothetical protein VFE42_22315 [Chloroflexota bacterium]|nr:hypothetical protein [Chloroflexota bacterium]